jgi:hypothetical protein
MHYFNTKTGEIFQALPNERILFFHLPLKETFKKDCSECYGKFHKGFNTSTNDFVLCPKCVKKYLDSSKYSSGKVSTTLQN